MCFCSWRICCVHVELNVALCCSLWIVCPSENWVKLEQTVFGCCHFRAHLVRVVWKVRGETLVLRWVRLSAAAFGLSAGYMRLSCGSECSSCVCAGAPRHPGPSGTTWQVRQTGEWTCSPLTLLLVRPLFLFVLMRSLPERWEDYFHLDKNLPDGNWKARAEANPRIDIRPGT